MQATEPFRQFLKHCAQGLLEQASTPETIAGANRLLSRLPSAPARDYHPQPQPVLASMDKLPASAHRYGFETIVNEIPWRHSSRTTDEGCDTALGTINEMLDLGDLVVGLLYLDSNKDYPLHQHNPQELYLVMAGQGQWRYGGQTQFQPRAPGDVIYNHPNDLHGIKAGTTPLLALYLLWP